MRTLSHNEIQAISGAGGDLFEGIVIATGTLGTMTSVVMAYYGSPYAMVPAITVALGTVLFLS